MKTTIKYATVGADFGLDGLELSDTPPQERHKRVQEEVVETFLALHLSQLIGLPAVSIFRAPPLWIAEDMLAIDELGRLHLFEVKKERIKEKHVRQLGQYLLGYVFADMRGFCEERVRLQS